MVDYTEESVKTDGKLLIELHEAIGDQAKIQKILEDIKERINFYFARDPRIQRYLNRRESPPVLNEDLATLMEWQAIIESCLVDFSEEESYQHAHSARLLRRGNWSVVKQEEFYFPILAEYEYTVCHNIEGAIDILKLLNDNGIHQASQTRLSQWRDELKEKTERAKQLEDEFLMIESSEEVETTNKKGGGKSKRRGYKLGKGQTSQAGIQVEPQSPVQVEPQSEELLALNFYFQKDVRLGNGAEGITTGFIKSNNREVGCSLLKPSLIQVTKIEDLVTVSQEHVNLMHVSNLVKDEGGNYLLSVSEKVWTLREFCEKEYADLAKKGKVTDEIWWANIKPLFDRIFGGVGQGLIHRFRSNLSCGDLSFSIFVSMKSFEGRILLSMKDKTTVDDDVRQWIDSMKTVIKFAHGKRNLDVEFKDKFDLELPDELIHLITFLTVQKRNLIDGYFWVDHPYFYTIDERVKYAKNLFKAIKFHDISYAIEKEFKKITTLVEGWGENLEGRYRLIWNKGLPVDEGGNEGQSLDDIAEEAQEMQVDPVGEAPKELATPVEVASQETIVAKPEYMHNFHQNLEEAQLSIPANDVPEECVAVVFGEQTLSVTINKPGEEPYHFQHRLLQKIVPDKCRFEVMSTKIEISLAKADALHRTYPYDIGDKSQIRSGKGPRTQVVPGNCVVIRPFWRQSEIMRYFSVTYYHRDDFAYCGDDEKLTDEEVENYLSQFYPSFNTETWESMCNFLWNPPRNYFKKFDLKAISNFRFFRSKVETNLPKNKWLG